MEFGKSLKLITPILHENCCSFLETSAKANVHIDTAFYELAEAILDKVCELLLFHIRTKNHGVRNINIEVE